MGRKFSVHFDDVPTGAVADAYSTLCALRAADTAGHRAALRAVSIGPADDAPADLNASIAVKRVDDVSAGGAGTANSNPTPVLKDSDSLAAIITAGEDYETGGVEPTVYGSALWEIEINRRGSVIKEWSFEDAPKINRDQLIGLLAAPRTAAVARFSGSMEFEEY